MAVLDIEKSLSEGDILTLQLETHGFDEGIGFNNVEILQWKDFYNIIRTLNIKTGHLLFVVMAMCKSITMISSINPEKRAPYRGLSVQRERLLLTKYTEAFSPFTTNISIY